ncbi:MAG: hypothetical protein CVU87_13395 [Firmicutes bacterium HGW-Firmicutes-12]|jgi:hypothetical protein|nr:MAG: hypothetical protein CVU87_13395 [Firmicutes bacterium HGW-Firmicutes-12]
MKKLVAGLLILLVFISMGVKEAYAVSDLDKFTGKWTCKITKASLLDLDGLRQQVEKINGSKIPNEQWEMMRATLTSSQTSAINELQNKSFIMDIYDSYQTGITADIISSDGTKSTSQSTSVSGESLVFHFNQFLLPEASSKSICTTRVVGKNLNGSVAIETNISKSGLILTLKSSLDFVGTMTESYAAPEEPKEPTRIDIINALGESVDTYYGKVGSKASFDYRIYPSDYDLSYIKLLEWYVNDETIATVDQGGLVSFGKIGETQLVVWINGDYDLSDSITIVVEDSSTADEKGQTSSEFSTQTMASDNNTTDTKSAGDSSNAEVNNSVPSSQDNGNDNKKEDTGKIIETVEKATSNFSDVVSKVSRFVPAPETMAKVPLLDLLVFTYEVDKDNRQNQGFGDPDKHSEQKAFWGNVVAAGPIGAVPKALDAVLEVSKKIGWDFDFSFEKTIKGTTNFLFDMFGSNSKASIEEIKKRHLKNHYGIIGGFGAWTASAINDISNWGRKTKEQIDKLE